jgi:hypothetical protein
MNERSLFIASWAAILGAMAAMVIGHTDAAPLVWTVNQISTYAAHAPHSDWITAGMLLPCVALVTISMLVSRYRILGDSLLAHAVPLLAGAAIAGLATVAAFKETAPDAEALKHAALDAVIQESFHNAGLMLFFYSTILLLLICGTLAAVRTARRARRLPGVLAVLAGLAALPLMVEPWPHLLGIAGPVHGLMQRASLFSLWLGAALILAASRRRPAGAPAAV